MNYKRGRPRTQPGGCWCKADKLLQVTKAKDVEAPEAPAPHRGRKDRKRWCGGHEGRPHVSKWVEESGWRQRFPKAGFVPETLTCQGCGKKLDYRRRCLDCGSFHHRSYWQRCEREGAA